jgi:hypothetical protein
MEEHHAKDLIACLKVELAAVRNGAIVSRPTTDFARYDRIIDWNGQLYRAQIKYVSAAAAHCEGAVQLNLRKNGGAFYSREEIDALLIYVPQTDCVYWLGPEIFHERATLQLRYAPAKNGQKTNCLLWEEHLW